MNKGWELSKGESEFFTFGDKYNSNQVFKKVSEEYQRSKLFL